ncbi:hypothetical protein BV898_03054 [Hypsibius exemplaris]|uniref:Uncharacterized protein n=1 Tax=Hypsibius exemplaris TaxID=2072580 RepID=A0A1W0X6I8_HYPEX|nr:hypothetical protein BV898_03054 [Hypsibius exemplaris]
MICSPNYYTAFAVLLSLFLIHGMDGVEGLRHRTAGSYRRNHRWNGGSGGGVSYVGYGGGYGLGLIGLGGYGGYGYGLGYGGYSNGVSNNNYNNGNSRTSTCNCVCKSCDAV